MSVRPVAEVVPLVAVPPSWRGSQEYQDYRGRLATAETYREAIEAVADLLRTPHGRRGLALDFAPSADWARRFVNSTKLGLSAPAGSPDRRRAERARRLLSDLLTPRRRRPPTKTTAPATLRAVRTRWHSKVSALDRDAPPQATASVLLGPSSPLAYRHDLAAMLRRHARPAAIADQLTAWQCEVPVRRVRESRTDTQDALHA